MPNTNLNQTAFDPSALMVLPQRLRDNVGKQKISESQNLFEADFEYGAQPMRWEKYIVGGATITQVPGQGGVQMSVTAAAGDVAIRQTRPYIRYQPGKTIYMASGFLFGAPYANQRQRVGFFDDGNGIFFEQGRSHRSQPVGHVSCLSVGRRRCAGRYPCFLRKLVRPLSGESTDHLDSNPNDLD